MEIVLRQRLGYSWPFLSVHGHSHVYRAAKIGDVFFNTARGQLHVANVIVAITQPVDTRGVESQPLVLRLKLGDSMCAVVHGVRETELIRPSGRFANNMPVAFRKRVFCSVSFIDQLSF